jgi:HK97 family phage portal protein
MTFLRLLERAAKPRVTPTMSSGSLEAMAAWQNLVYGNWPNNGTYYPLAHASENEVLGLPVVGGFLTIVTGLVLQMPLHAYKGSRNVGDRCDLDPLIIKNPAPGSGRTFGMWIEEYLRDLILHGNYLAVLGPNDGKGWPALMYPVPCEQWTVLTLDQNLGTYVYEINGQRYDPRDIFHVKVHCRTGELVGKGICELYPGLISSAVAAERWAASYFEGGAVPPAQVEHPNPELTQDQADEFKAKWNLAVRAHEAVVTPAGTTVKVLDSNAEDAQLNDTRKQNGQQLAMALGIPGALLGLDSPSLTYRNITDVFQQFITTTVMGLLIPLEQQLTEQCIPRTHQAYFSTNDVLRPDLAERVSIAVQGLAANLLTEDEARSLVDLPPKNQPNVHEMEDMITEGTTHE